MKILFFSHNHGNQMDYAHDCVLSGFKELYGDACVDYPRVDYMYKGYVGRERLYGKGFTLAATLPEDKTCHREDVWDKIEQRYYDLVVFGSVIREHSMLGIVSQHYNREKVILVDGEDYQHLLLGLRQQGLYFKRELAEPKEGVYPIHFAMPRSKIRKFPLEKTQRLATCDPRDPKTYIFENEEDYYRDYAKSLFAYTTSKAGWDTLRHNEIIACGCLPLFLDIKDCPAWTCINLPKPELIEALDFEKEPLEYWNTEDGHNRWLSLYRRMYLKWVCRSTTTALADYIVSVSNGAPVSVPA